MAEQQERSSLGSYLKSLRVKRGLGLDDVSYRTNISRQNLIRLEADDYVNLPAPVHTKGFLKAYSELLGLPSERVLQYYTEEIMAEGRAAKAQGAGGRFGFWPRFILALSILALVVSLTLYGAVFWEKKAQSQISLAKTADKEASRRSVDGGAPSERLDPGALPGVESSGTNLHSLKITAVEPTQLKVIIDGQAPQIYQLKPDDQLELEAGSNFNLLLNNAEGVELLFDEKPIRLSGKAGQNVTIQLP